MIEQEDGNRKNSKRKCLRDIPEDDKWTSGNRSSLGMYTRNQDHINHKKDAAPGGKCLK